MDNNIINEEYSLIKTEKKLIDGIETIIIYYTKIEALPIKEITFDFILEKKGEDTNE